MLVFFLCICFYNNMSILIATALQFPRICMTKSVYKLSSLTPNLIQILSVFAIILCMSILFLYLTYSTLDTQEQYAVLIVNTLGFGTLLYFLYWLHTKSTFRSLSIEKVMQLECSDFVRYLCVLLRSRGYTRVTILSQRASQTIDLIGIQNSIPQLVRIHMYSTPPGLGEVQAIYRAQKHPHFHNSVLICRSNVSARTKKYGKDHGVLVIDAGELHAWIQAFSSEAML